jgi:hypothetical protein
MSEEKSSVKINKNHGGKEFINYFRFIGQVKPLKKKEDETWVEQPFFEQGITKTNKPRRVLQFVLETAKGNELKIENNGMERDFAYAYSNTEKKSHRLNWSDRNDESKYPNETYHLLPPEWDLVDQLKVKLSEGSWVEVKGKYEFDTMIGENNQEINLVKRMVTEINPIENAQEIRLGQEKFNYVTDFDSPDFRELNTFRMQIGIRSTYQNEEDKNTKVNGVYLAYGKERSIPKNVDLMVFYSEPEEGKVSLADAFARLNRLDFVEVQGVDNNRVEYTYVPVEEKNADDNPFGDVDEQNKSVKMQRATSGSRKGLEVLSYVQGTYIKDLLTEDEITLVEQTQNNDNPLVVDLDELPF